jgi:DNA-directed RNA polymerase subunit RPC12/RpoP
MNMIWSRKETAEAARDRQRSDARCVTCPACSREIPVAGRQRLPQEFSVLCPGCGHRRAYQADEAHEPKPVTGASRTPAKVEFGKKAAM